MREHILNTVTYEVNNALRVPRHITDNDCKSAHEVSKALKYRTYMDDTCVEASSLSLLYV